jgi:hypothetical protein
VPAAIHSFAIGAGMAVLQVAITRSILPDFVLDCFLTLSCFLAGSTQLAHLVLLL